MSGADWNAGDLAICIREGTWITHGIGPRKGQILPVRAVIDLSQVVVVGPRSHPCYLEFAEWGRDFTFGCGNFTKIQPLSDLERHRAESEIDVEERLSRKRERAL